MREVPVLLYRQASEADSQAESGTSILASDPMELHTVS